VLAVGAVAYADKDGLRIRTVPHLPAQAAAFDVSHAPVLLVALWKTATPARPVAMNVHRGGLIIRTSPFRREPGQYRQAIHVRRSRSRPPSP